MDHSLGMWMPLQLAFNNTTSTIGSLEYDLQLCIPTCYQEDTHHSIVYSLSAKDKFVPSMDQMRIQWLAKVFGQDTVLSKMS